MKVNQKIVELVRKHNESVKTANNLQKEIWGMESLQRSLLKDLERSLLALPSDSEVIAINVDDVTTVIKFDCGEIDEISHYPTAVIED